ncbi:NAD(P)-binding domain-containing protein [Caballeronia sp. LZ016]|uniref:NAD(P)-binding domain-containing protein n=1 Tax=Caballeronia sp. LZ016 TaxID=3038554 RepID=UPI002860367C|nr:NAD(P)-binding domain-containing protein [Caballeronia sp. LZ016]MDR5740182.1 hypothetical protein [Caballeronia sp. LZ016]
MGAAIAPRLHEMGVEVTAWNRFPEKAEASGLPIAYTLHVLCERSDIIITSLFDRDSAAMAVYCGDEGLLGAGAAISSSASSKCVH